MRAVDPRDAAVTGIGLVTALGADAPSTWAACLAGRSGVREVEPADAPAGVRFAATVDAPRLVAAPPPEVEGQAKFLNPAGEMAAQAAAEAAAAARLAEGPPPQRRGLFLAQVDDGGWSSVDFRPAVLAATEEFARPLEAAALNEATLRAVRPYYLLERLNNNAFSCLAAWHGLRGANTSLSGFSGLGLAAVSMAARAVRRGDADLAMAVGAARLSGSLSRHELLALGVGGPRGGGLAPCRPFDRSRDGLAPGEAAGALVLEPLALAWARGLEPLALVLGHGASTLPPAAGTWSPPPEGLVLAARGALEEAQVAPADLLCVVAPGSGSVAGDRAVLAALRETLRGTTEVPVVSVRGATGSAGLGGDVVEAALAALALRDGRCPGSAGFSDAEPGFESVRAARASAAGKGAAVLVLSAGLDGQSFAVLLARP